MRKLLRKHVVFFKFKKKNGEIRRAVGTLISSYLPALRGGAPKPEHQMVYYDLEKEHWRSFRSFSFIKILDIKSEDEYKGKIIKKEKEEEKLKEKERRKELHKEKLKDKESEEKSKFKKEEHSEKEHDEKDEKDDEDPKKKTYKVGEKIPEKELMRRSSDFRVKSRKNRFTIKSNDAHKKGKLDDEDED
ncbi:MAG: SH3 beta-barrel fold-containing protein [Lachnospiraceae bacterium]|nr:SH3 beta-barrel fold-containing protein [Lachnospiraceae bacterium]